MSLLSQHWVPVIAVGASGVASLPDASKDTPQGPSTYRSGTSVLTFFVVFASQYLELDPVLCSPNQKHSPILAV